MRFSPSVSTEPLTELPCERAASIALSPAFFLFLFWGPDLGLQCHKATKTSFKAPKLGTSPKQTLQMVFFLKKKNPKGFVWMHFVPMEWIQPETPQPFARPPPSHFRCQAAKLAETSLHCMVIERVFLSMPVFLNVIFGRFVCIYFLGRAPS